MHLSLCNSEKNIDVKMSYSLLDVRVISDHIYLPLYTFCYEKNTISILNIILNKYKSITTSHSYNTKNLMKMTTGLIKKNLRVVCSYGLTKISMFFFVKNFIKWLWQLLSETINCPMNLSFFMTSSFFMQ